MSPLKNTVFVVCWQDIPILHDPMIDFHHHSHGNIVDHWFPCFEDGVQSTTSWNIISWLVFFAITVVMLPFKFMTRDLRSVARR